MWSDHVRTDRQGRIGRGRKGDKNEGQTGKCAGECFALKDASGREGQRRVYGIKFSPN